MIRDSDNTGQWKFKNPENGTVDSATVNTLLLDLQEARIQKFAPSKKLKLFGLDAPRKKLTVFKKAKSEMRKCLDRKGWQVADIMEMLP